MLQRCCHCCLRCSIPSLQLLELTFEFLFQFIRKLKRQFVLLCLQLADPPDVLLTSRTILTIHTNSGWSNRLAACPKHLEFALRYCTPISFLAPLQLFYFRLQLKYGDLMQGV